MVVYHVVTDRPMYIGQKIVFDATHHSGVYERVRDKINIVSDIYENPEKYKNQKLEHHISVALRELALEDVRQKIFPDYPSRMNCLYVSETLAEANEWAKFFAGIGRPTYSIVKLEVDGNYFVGDATKCFDGTVDKQENIRLAKTYWENKDSNANNQSICEMLVDGNIKVIEVVREIHANID